MDKPPMIDLKKSADKDKNVQKTAAAQERDRLLAAKKHKKQSDSYKMIKKGVTIRGDQDEYLFKLAQKLGAQRKRIVNISEILRVIIDVHMEAARLASEKPVKES